MSVAAVPCLAEVNEAVVWPATEAFTAQFIEELDSELFFVAASPVMCRIRQQLQALATLDAPVLVVGESGTGKDIVATLLHRLSARRDRALIKVNCAAIPSELLESELFGYENGAFTGAHQRKPGKFELSDHGTILLDEIAEMPFAAQAKLLHVLQDRTIWRLGSRSSIAVDVRIIAATNVDIERALNTGSLRPDLYYRLNAFQLCMPPLRERLEEVPILFNCYMKQFSQRFGRPARPLTAGILRACRNHHWPGNVRELINFVQRYLVLGEESLTPQAADSIHGAETATSQGIPNLKQLVRTTKRQVEASVIKRALSDTNGHRGRAAKALGISTKALSYKLCQYRLAPMGNRRVRQPAPYVC